MKRKSPSILSSVAAVAVVTGLWASCAAAREGWPPADPDRWGLAIVDVETTGLDPDHHEMVDLGAIYTDLEGEEIARFFVRIKPDHPDRAGAVARGINGYSPKRWASLGAVSEREAIARFRRFHAETAGERTFLFTAYNAYFDRAFLDALLREESDTSFRELYSYFVLDLPSMAWGAGIRDLRNADVAAALGLDPETDDPLRHTGLSGAEWNLTVYRALMVRGQNAPPAADP